jgi:hypothetical protein
MAVHASPSNRVPMTADDDALMNPSRVLLLGLVAPASRPADAFDDLLGRQVIGVGFLSHGC